MKIGVIIFDDSDNGGAGWAAKSGEEANRVNDINSLDQDYIWITNIEFEKFNELEYRRTANLRETHFMRITVKALITELNLSSSPSLAAETLAKIFQRVIVFGNEMFGVDPSGKTAFRYANLLSDEIIPEHMKQKPAQNSESIMDALKESTQYMQQSLGKKPPGNDLKSITLNMPRIAYNNWLISRKVPIEREWGKVQFSKGSDEKESIEIGIYKGKSIDGTKTIISKLEKLAEKNAFLFNINVKSVEESHKSFASFNIGKREKRRWVTFPELFELQRYAHIEIKKAIKTDIGEIDQSLKDKNPGTNFSFSKGLFLENLINALYTPVKNNRQEIYNGIIPYLRAYDRMACLRAAEVLQNEGYYIYSYGVGKITLLVNESEINSLIGKALSLGLIPPLSKLMSLREGDVEIESEDLITGWMPQDLDEHMNNDWFLGLLRMIVSTGLITTDLLMSIDDVVELRPEEQSKEIDSIIETLSNMSVTPNSEGENNRLRSDDTEIIDL